MLSRFCLEAFFDHFLVGFFGGEMADEEVCYTSDYEADYDLVYAERKNLHPVEEDECGKTTND